jgi:hypothetical protein
MADKNLLPTIVQKELASSGVKSNIFPAVIPKEPLSYTFDMLLRYGLEYGMQKAVALAKRTVEDWRNKSGSLSTKEEYEAQKMIEAIETYGSENQTSFVDSVVPRSTDATLMDAFRCLSQHVGGDVKAVKRYLAAIKILSEPGAMAVVERILYLREV